MRIDLSGVIICGQRLEKMVDFLFKISDSVELISSVYHEMTKEEYETAQTEREYLQKELYRTNGLTDEEIDEIHNGCMEEIDFANMTDEEIQQEIELRQKISNAQENEIHIRETSFIKAEEINAIVEEKFKDLVCTQRRVTCQTHCTLGGATVVYSFLTSKELKKHFLQMELLTWPLKTKKRVFLADDPAFYRKGKKVCSICSHEGYITLYLNKEQTKEFINYGIPYYLDESKTELKQDFPFLKETVCVFSMGSAVTTLLGRGLFDYRDDAFEDYLAFYQWFDEHQDMIRTQTRPCKKSAHDIVAHLQREYTLQPYHSKAIERQCQRHGWDALFSRPSNLNSQQTMPEFETFLYRLNYQGEELIIGGEYNSDYLFVDMLKVEKKLNNLVENLDGKICGFTERSSLTEPLFHLMREINIYRGIDEYEKYDSAFLRTYIQTLRYEEIKSKKWVADIMTK